MTSQIIIYSVEKKKASEIPERSSSEYGVEYLGSMEYTRHALTGCHPRPAESQSADVTSIVDGMPRNATWTVASAVLQPVTRRAYSGGVEDGWNATETQELPLWAIRASHGLSLTVWYNTVWYVTMNTGLHTDGLVTRCLRLLSPSSAAPLLRYIYTLHGATQHDTGVLLHAIFVLLSSTSSNAPRRLTSENSQF